MMKDVREVLYDSQAALRLVDSALLDMTGIAEETPAAPPVRSRTPQDADAIVAQGHEALVRMLQQLRASRSMLQKSELDRLAQTHDKLREVSSATETAATDILDGLERATAMVDELDALDGDSTPAPAAGVRSRLRDELFGLVGHMQFQDITSQQLAFASAVLSELEVRLSDLVQIFGAATDEGGVPEMGMAAAFDPSATTLDRETRQAVADAIVAGTGPRA